MKKLPTFSSERDEARFWATHSPLDYPGEFTEVKYPIRFAPTLLKHARARQAERKRLLTIRMGQRQIDVAKLIARWRGLGYQTQMRIWVIEGIRKDLQAHPELKQLLHST
jgi:hypothetical protein